ncbi:MAG: type II toxin-antitoxin system death-on-curing family toxin [Candidatus Woesearchaeota archaeon]
MMTIKYPTTEKIIEFNILSLTIIKVKRADDAKILNRGKIEKVINECKEKEGDYYDKAVVLIKGLIQQHAFASGNRRTAFITTKDFLINNKAHFRVKDDPDYVSVMQGIREDYYSDDELKEWMKNGKIRKFRR